jgi:Bacterial Ig-like domain (group 3)/NHL repeat
MMTVSLRAAHPSQLRISLAAVRSCFVLMLLALFAGSAFGQGLTPDTSVNFGPVNLGATTTPNTITFTPPTGGVTIQAVSAVTEGAVGKDFKVVPTVDECNGLVLPPDTCTVGITFTPSQIGVRLGALIITNNTGAVINTIFLSGIGVGPQFVFSPARAFTTSSASTLTPAAFTAGAAVQDGNGNLFFTDPDHSRILERSSLGVFSVVPTGVTLNLTATSGIAIDGVGNLYIASGTNVFILAPGIATATTLSTPGVILKAAAGLAMDPSGVLYIADSTANTIYQVALGSDSTEALPLAGPGASLLGPTGLAIDSKNDLFIADSNHNRIIEEQLGTANPSTIVTIAPALINPTGLAVDAAGTLYIANTGSSEIVESTAAATPDQFVLTDPDLTLDTPSGIVIEGTGNLVITDSSLGLVFIPRSAPFVRFPTPTVVGTLDTTDGAETLTVQETGNILSTLTAAPDPSFSGTDPTAFLLANTGTCPSLNSGGTPGTFAIGAVCTYALDFQPTVVGPNKADLVLTTAAGALSTTGTAKLFGIGLSTLNHFTLVAVTMPPTTPTTVDLGGTVELILTAIQSDNNIATDFVGTVTFTTTDSNGVFPSGATFTFTAADAGVLKLPSGLTLNMLGIFTATATAATSSLPPNANGVAISNDIFVVEPSTLTLTSSVNPSVINQSTTFTLHVATTGTTPPAGMVIFSSNGVEIGEVTLGTNGSASIAHSFAAAGDFTITAAYSSTSNTQPGTATLIQVVGNATSVALTSSVNPSLVGQSTTLTATITALASPTGTVTFFSGATSLGMVPVTGTTASLSTSFATAGTYSLTAVYSSTDSSVTGATSLPLSQVVENVATLTLTSSVNPSNINQPTMLTATLAALGTPAGTVVFYDGTTVIGTVTLTGTTASVSVSFATSGTHTLKAVFTSSNNSTENATSAPLLQVVLNATTVTLASSVNPSLVNQSTTLTAAVTSAGTPSGTVTFKSNGAILGTATLTAGVATLTVSFPTAGDYTLTAVYGGDSNNQAMTSAPITQVVLNVATIALTSSINPVLLDNPTLLTAVVTSTGPTPTGTINFFDGNTPIGSGTLANGTLAISASFVYAGTHTITATYSGNTVTAPATSLALSQTVADFSLTVASGSSSTASTVAGGTASFSLALTPIVTSTLPSAVTLTFSGLPTTVTGVLTPTTIAAGSGVTPVTFGLTAAYLIAAQHNPPPSAHRSPARYVPVALALMALPLAWFRRRKRFGSLLASVCLLFALTAGLSGCVSDPTTGYYGQTPQTYNLTVTATSGNLVRSTFLTLTVQ